MITLCIPTKDRPELLARVLRYYRGQGARFQVVIADSSLSPVADANQRLVDSLRSSLDLRYLRYEPEIHVAQKIARALEQVETPYAALGADDDFSVPAALDRAAGFLAAHPDYALAHGDAILFHAPAAAADNGGGPLVIRYPQRSVEQATGALRLLDHLSHYALTFYSLHRTALLRDTWKVVSGLELDYAFVELLPSCLAIIQGKSKQLGGLYLARQGHAAQTSVTHLRDPLEWVADPSWASQQARVRRVLAEALARQDGLTLEAAREVVKQAFWSCLAKTLTTKWDNRYGQRGIAARLRFRAMARRIAGLRSAWRAARALLPGSHPAISLEALRRPSSVYHTDFMPIYRVVTEGAAGGPA